ncbi:uncharacterized protein P884DRAFT_263699 [Thermothelomyces heterothallicus CBS 202.75]|uniref:uncharacterized protein n=1 Tax=Thermothelomyces heterothallicus CBS 202.75 TaxID=1149848 RepID=UPI003741ECBF
MDQVRYTILPCHGCNLALLLRCLFCFMHQIHYQKHHSHKPSLLVIPNCIFLVFYKSPILHHLVVSCPLYNMLLVSRA